MSSALPDLTARHHDTHHAAAPALGGRVLVFAYGLVSYAIFFGTFLYAYGFVAGVGTPTSLDRTAGPGALPWAAALLVDLALLGLFAVQHSVMARPWFKARWTRIIHPAAERSTYVLLSSVALIVLFAFWQPLGGVVWSAEHPALRAALLATMGAGWLLVLVSTFLINHFDLFGLRQVWLHLLGRPYTHLPFKTPALYRWVRHPLYVGWLIAFWVTPTMTAAHLAFAIVTTAYILAAIRWEERDLSDLHGEPYRAYRRQVPMLVPARGRRASRMARTAGAAALLFFLGKGILWLALGAAALHAALPSDAPDHARSSGASQLRVSEPPAEPRW